MSKGLAITTTQRTDRAPNDSRPCPPLCNILYPLPTPIHTLPTSDFTFGFCSHTGSGTAGPCSHGDRCSPSTWLDLDLGSNGQASLTRVDGQLQRMRRRHRLHPSPVSICRTVATSLSRQEGQGHSDSCILPPLCATAFKLSTRPGHPECNRATFSTLHGPVVSLPSLPLTKHLSMLILL